MFCFIMFMRLLFGLYMEGEKLKAINLVGCAFGNPDVAYNGRYQKFDVG